MTYADIHHHVPTKKKRASGNVYTLNRMGNSVFMRVGGESGIHRKLPLVLEP